MINYNNNALSTETRTALTAELLTVGRAIRKGLKGGFNVDGLAAEADLLIDALKTKENTDVIEYDTTSGNANR